MKSPKQRFLELKTVAQAHRDLVDHDATLESLETALLQLLHEYSNVTVGNDAAANFFRVQGARDFIRTFLHLADPIQEKTYTDYNIKPV